MSYNFYLFLHLFAALLVVLGYGALLARAILAPENKPMRVKGAILSGIGLLLLLVAGFGMQAKLGIGWPVWFIAKIVLWVLLGAALSLINKKPAWNCGLWVAIIAIVGLAAWLGVFGKTIPALQ